MKGDRVLVLDACVGHDCQHFDGLQRWIGLFAPHVRVIRGGGGLLQAWPHDAHDAPDFVVAHVAARAVADSVRADAARLFPRAHVLVAVHAANRRERFCIGDDLLATLRGLLPERHGSPLPFEVLPGVVGSSSAVCTAAAQVRLIADSGAICLLQGETGTGKELFARAIHYLSARKRRPFVPVNCGAIADSLFENEMFGHVRGAYTDARDERQGLLAHAEDGTVFLDEVDCLSPSAQVKLLRVLQEHEYRPVGSPRCISTDVRVVAATNADLRQRVQQRLFREDLFHRLNVLRLHIPPLRDRAGDLPLLARTFVRMYAQRYRREAPTVADDVFDAVERYDWPGNVREMQAVFERAVLLARNGVITAADLDVPSVTRASADMPGMTSAKERAIHNFERRYLHDVLARCEGNVTLAARIAHKERRTFQRLLRKHNLNGAAFRLPRASSE